MTFEYLSVSVAQKLTELRIFGCQRYFWVNLGTRPEVYSLRPQVDKLDSLISCKKFRCQKNKFSHKKIEGQEMSQPKT